MSETTNKTSTPNAKRMVSEEAYLAVVETCRGLSHALLAARDMVRGLDNVLFIDRALADPRGLAQQAAAKADHAPMEYRTCCDHPDCTTCAGRGGFYRLPAMAAAQKGDA